MQSKIALILAALVAIASATPVASPQAEASPESTLAPPDKGESVAPGTYHKLDGPSPIATQATTHLYVCTDYDFHGRCENLESTKQGCYTLFNGFDNEITSLGPDQGTTCTIYDGASVGGIVYPGIYNLKDYNFNDRASSYRCN
ncbi:MAG: hypothetical protein LQ338_003440 [Usnochroma carphineum]|nr:MAG: hypothetical protein LQ338_003440 [Usnochroma carphineum]